MKTLEQLTNDLVTKGGAIVCSQTCSEYEIHWARACGDMAVFDGIGFIRRSKEWVGMAHDGLIARIRDDLFGAGAKRRPTPR